MHELQALIEIEIKKEAWARKMRHLLCHAANLARDRDAPQPPRFIAPCYDAILAEGFAFYEAPPS